MKNEPPVDCYHFLLGTPHNHPLRILRFPHLKSVFVHINWNCLLTQLRQPDSYTAAVSGSRWRRFIRSVWPKRSVNFLFHSALEILLLTYILTYWLTYLPPTWRHVMKMKSPYLVCH